MNFIKIFLRYLKYITLTFLLIGALSGSVFVSYKIVNTHFSQPEADTICYKTWSGECYHTYDCPNRTRNWKETTYSDAIINGYKECSKCEVKLDHSEIIKRTKQLSIIPCSCFIFAFFRFGKYGRG